MFSGIGAGQERDDVSMENVWRNLVVNGSFEDGLTDWAPSRADLPAMLDTGAKVDAGASLRLSKTDNRSYTLRQGVAGPLVAGRTYTLSAWVRTADFVAAGGRIALIGEGWRWESPARLPDGTNTWTRISTTFVLPASRLFQAIVYLPAGAKGTLWVDAVQLEEGSVAASYQETIIEAARLIRTLQATAAGLAEQRRVVETRLPEDFAAGFRSHMEEQAAALLAMENELAALLASPTTQKRRAGWSERRQYLTAASGLLAREVESQSLLVRIQSPWQQKRPLAVAPETVTADIQLSAYSGEQADAAVVFTNISDSTLYLRLVWDSVRAEPLPATEQERWQAAQRLFGDAAIGDAGAPMRPLRPDDCVTLREALPIPSAVRGPLVADVLPALNQARVVTIPPADSREVFLTCDTANLTPGTYRTSLRLLGPDGVLLRRIPVEIEVSPLRLYSSDKRFPRLAPWGAILTNAQAADNPYAYQQDAWDHGINVVQLNPGWVVPRFDRQGQLLDIDFTVHDRYLQAYRAAAREGPLFYLGHYSVFQAFQTYANRSGLSSPSVEYDKAFQAWMKAWIAHLLELGLDYADFAFQIRDEPNEAEEFAFFLRGARLLREADPQARILLTVNFSDPQMLQQAAAYTDIWVVLGQVLTSPGVAGFLQGTGGEVWVYQTGNQAKSLDPQGYYRVLGWIAHLYHLQGWGFFTVLWANEDPWILDEEKKNYATIYTSPEGPLPSRRWEAFRKGREDFLALSLWAYVADRAEACRVEPAAVAAARQVVDNAVQQAIGHVDYGSTFNLPSEYMDSFDAARQVIRQQTEALIELAAQASSP